MRIVFSYCHDLGVLGVLGVRGADMYNFGLLQVYGMSQSGGTTHWPCELNFCQILVRCAQSAKYLVHCTCLLIILLFVDNDRFDHYLYNGNSSNQEGNLAGRMNYISAGPSPLRHLDNSSQIWHLIMTKVSTHLLHLQSKL